MQIKTRREKGGSKQAFKGEAEEKALLCVSAAGGTQTKQESQGKHTG